MYWGIQWRITRSLNNFQCQTGFADGFADLIAVFDTASILSTIPFSDSDTNELVRLDGNFTDGKAFFGVDVIIVDRLNN